MKSLNWKQLLAAFLCALFGMALWTFGWAWYDDHQLLNQIRANAAQQQARDAQQIRQFQQQQAPPPK